MGKIENRWTKIAAEQLVGRKIVRVRYMTTTEAQSLGWCRRPIVLELDDGNVAYPASDDEGNDAGALFTAKDNTLPVLRMND